MYTTPKHLSSTAQKIWQEIAEDYQITDCAGQRILQVACEAFDRAQAAREKIDTDGMTITGRDGQIKNHPLVTVERDSRAAFLAGLKALNLDLEPLKSAPGRPGGK